MDNFEQLQQQTNEVQLDFLLADVRTAFTFLDIAETTRNTETRARNLQHATAAYAAVERFLPRVTMTGEQSADMQEKLRVLKQRIRSFENSSLQS